MTKKLLSILLTFVILLLVIGIGYLFYNFHNQALSVLICGIGLMFIRHIYVAVYHSLDEKM
jgi:hypothetical protein